MDGIGTRALHVDPASASSPTRLYSCCSLPTQAVLCRYVIALLAEFLGSMLFSFTGSAILYVALNVFTEPNIVMAALGNGFALTVAGRSA